MKKFSEIFKEKPVNGCYSKKRLMYVEYINKKMGLSRPCPVLDRQRAFFLAEGLKLPLRFFWNRGWQRLPRKIKKSAARLGWCRDWLNTQWTPDFD